MESRPGLAAAIAMGDEAVLDRIELLLVIHRVAQELEPQDPTARAEAAMRRMWPNWR